MQSLWDRLARFLKAEEVPRWFGLSIVLIYLVGLGTVMQYGINQAKREAAAHFDKAARHSVKLLAQRLSAMPGAKDVEPAWVSGCQIALDEFAGSIPVRLLHVVDSSRQVIASVDATKTGEVAPDPARGNAADGTFAVVSIPVQGQFAPDTFIRALLGGPTVIRSDGSPESPSAEPLSLMLEVRLPPEPPGMMGMTNRASVLSVVLVVLGALFVVYRCLREQLRSVSRIADRLYAHRHRLEQELDSLTIADTLDSVTSAWNELIGLTQRLAQSAEQSEANDELSRVLQQTGGLGSSGMTEMLNAIPDGIVYITEEARIEQVNSTACRMLGVSATDTESMTLSNAKVTGVGETILDLIRKAQCGDGCFEARSDVLMVEEEGESCGTSYRVHVIPIQRPHHQGECVVVIRDVSQQIRADRSREEFITHVTHELRTPLTNIRAYAETLSSGMFDDPNVITECYNVITKETRRLSRLIEDILSVSQLEVGSVELNSGDVDLRALLTDGVRDARGAADDKGLDVQLALPAKLEPIRGDRDKLAIVVNNLLGNAIKYTPENGNVIIGCQISEGKAVLTFKDNGIGIDPADHARVFEKFQRGSDPEVLSETGTGIGLYTSREIVRRHHGEIELISEKGKGSTFLVRLPHQESRAAAMSTAEEA